MEEDIYKIISHHLQKNKSAFAATTDIQPIIHKFTAESGTKSMNVSKGNAQYDLHTKFYCTFTFRSAFPTSSVASPICQEGQSERTFPILPFLHDFSSFSLIFPDCFPLPPPPPPRTPSGYATVSYMLKTTRKILNGLFLIEDTDEKANDIGRFVAVLELH